MINGIGASSGIAIAKAYKLVMPDLTVTKVTVEDADAEIKKYDDAMTQTAKELELISRRSSSIWCACISIARSWIKKSSWRQNKKWKN